MRTPIFLWTLLIGILSHVALGQDDFSAQLQNASAQGDIQALSQTFKRLQQAHPSDWQTTLNACFDLPQECTTDSAPQWCSAFNQVQMMPEECLSVLHTAAISWQAASVTYLLSSTNDGPMMEVDAPTNKTNTPLSLAFQGFTVYWHPCQEQFRDTVIALLKNGADPKVPFPYGGVSNYTVLQSEAYDGNRHGLIADLVNAGADVNQTDDRGYTSLHSAAKCDFRLSCDDCGCSPITQSCPSSSDSAVDASKVSCPSLTKIANNATVQFFGAAPTLQYLVANGGDPTAKGDDGKMPIDLVPTPPGDLNNASAWQSGSCKTTYDYLKSVTSNSS